MSDRSLMLSAWAAQAIERYRLRYHCANAAAVFALIAWAAYTFGVFGLLAVTLYRELNK